MKKQLSARFGKKGDLIKYTTGVADARITTEATKEVTGGRVR